MAGTHGIGNFGINSKFASGNLVFYEKSVGRTATGDVLTVGTTKVTVGGTGQDVDFQFYATGSISMLLDAGAKTLTLDDIDISLGDNDELRFGDATGGDVVVKWDATNLTIIPATDNVGVLEVGNDGTKSMDVKFYGATASAYLLWDNSDNRLELDGADINLQDADILQFGDAQDVAITWDATNLTIIPATDNTGVLEVGNDGTKSMDVKFYGATASNSLLWDNSEDQLVLTQTNAATTGVERTLDISQTHTGIGASAEATRSTITTNVAGGTYMNALFGKIDFQTVGKVTGLAGVVCSELTMAGGAVSQGTYCTFESEINLPTSYSSTVPIMALRMEVWGAQKATFDTTGYLFEIVGCSSTNNGFWYDSTNGTTDEWIRVKTPSGNRWLMLSDSPTEA